MELWRHFYFSIVTNFVADVVFGVYGSFPSSLTNVNGTLYFAADGGAVGRELWKTTGFGAELVKDIVPGWANSSSPSRLTNVAGTLYFMTYDAADQLRLWKTDGTDAGTVLISNLFSSGGSDPDNFTDVDGRLYFSSADSAAGMELWTSDGTLSGTVRVGDIAPNAPGSWPRYLTNSAGTLFFSADDGLNGRELWAVVPPVSATIPGDYNRDHTIDGADYDFWRSHFSETSGAGVQADGNRNEVVDAADYVMWRKNTPVEAPVPMSAVLIDPHSEATISQTTDRPTGIAVTAGAPVGAEVEPAKSVASGLQLEFPRIIETGQPSGAARTSARAREIAPNNNAEIVLVNSGEETSRATSSNSTDQSIRRISTDYAAVDSVFSDGNLTPIISSVLRLRMTRGIVSLHSNSFR
jgi:ELWxxDGT repeat protein